MVLVHYSDPEADLAGQMRWLADRLGIDVPDHQWDELVEAAGFESRRRCRRGTPRPGHPRPLPAATGQHGPTRDIGVARPLRSGLVGGRRQRRTTWK